MSKDEAVIELNKRDFKAVNDGGVVIVYSDTLSSKELQKILTDIGYNASYGLLPLSRLKAISI